MAKVRQVTIVPVAVADVRSGNRVKLGYHEATADVASARKTTANGKPCYVLDLRYKGESHETYVGVDHTFWLVTDEQIVEVE